MWLKDFIGYAPTGPPQALGRLGGTIEFYWQILENLKAVL